MPSSKNERGFSKEWMLALALIIGLLGGLGSVVFRWMVALVHNFLFLGKFSFVYYEKIHTPPSIWGMGIICVPMIVAPLVVFLIENFAHEEKGLSVPEIMYKLREKGAAIVPRIALVKTLTSSLSIGSGGSLGREGPVAQIGASLASLICDFFKILVKQRVLLVAAGVAASTGAIFNAPLTGIAFAVELMLVSYDVFTLLLLYVATISACSVANLFLWSAPLFYLPPIPLAHMNYYFMSLLFFIPFGLIVGLLSVFLIRGVYFCEDSLKLLFPNHYIRHILGMTLVGILIYLFMYFYGHYYIEGVGFATIRDVLWDLIRDPRLLILLFLGKLIATCLTLGSGASGGIFSPSLFLGALIGAIVGHYFQVYFPQLEISPVLFVAAGMAGMIASASGARITAIILLCEMTYNFQVILPVMVSVICAYAMRKLICKESIYTLKLARRGITL